MKLYKKLAYLFALAMLSTGMAACSDDDEYVPAQPVPEDCMQVYFATTDAEKNPVPTEYEIAPEALASTTIDLPVVRVWATEAASVPVTSFQKGDLFVVPETVEFAAGQKQATLKIKMNKVDKGEFALRLAIEDPAYANPYANKDGGGTPLFGFTVNVVKWNLLGTGDYYYNSLFSGVDKGLELYQKDGSTEHKLCNWGGGVDLMFNVAADGTITIPSQYIGADHPTYGAVYITSDNSDAASRYDAASKTYFINGRWYCAAGNFGTMPEKFVVTNPAK